MNANTRGRLFFVAGTIFVLIVGFSILALLSGRTVGSQSRTTVQGKLAITSHGVAPIFGGGELRAEYDVPVVNWWREPLNITQVHASCSCSRADVTDTHLKPGEKTTLKIEVKLPPTGGEREISCTLAAESDHRLVHKFKVVGYPYVQLAAKNESGEETGRISFGTVPPDSEVELTRLLYLHAPSSAGEPPHVISVKCATDAITSSIDADSASMLIDGAACRRRSATLGLRLRTGSIPGLRSSNISIEYSGNGLAGKHSIPVLWEVARVFVVNPARILRVEEMEEGRGSAHAIIIEIDPNRARSSKSFTELEIATDRPAQPIVRVPVSLFRTTSEPADR